MKQKFSLDAAGKLLGVSANAVRARAKKNPDKYAIERDNRGKIWVYLDPEIMPILKPSKNNSLGSTVDELKVSIGALHRQANLLAEASSLRENLATVESERDRLRERVQAQEALLSDRAEQISYLRSRLDKEGEERRRLAAILTDQSAVKPGVDRRVDGARRRWWPW